MCESLEPPFLSGSVGQTRGGGQKKTGAQDSWRPGPGEKNANTHGHQTFQGLGKERLVSSFKYQEKKKRRTSISELCSNDVARFFSGVELGVKQRKTKRPNKH